MLRLLRVSGESLSPTYHHGDYVLVAHPVLVGGIKPGDVVVFRHHQYGTMIKRVDRVARDRDDIYVVGTHETSVDSRKFGPIGTRMVVGKVIWHIKRP